MMGYTRYEYLLFIGLFNYVRFGYKKNFSIIICKQFPNVSVLSLTVPIIFINIHFLKGNANFFTVF